MKPNIFTMPNGIRIVHEFSTGSPIAHCALVINAGTRNEIKGKEGIAHFIEHVLFKGTRNRKAYHILSRMENVGGEMNAYTAKEETCVHSSFMEDYFERAAELLSDIVFCSVFPAKEIVKEKEIVLDEIRSYQDSPYEQIYDDFEGLVFFGHPLGNPTLGTVDSVKNFKRKDIFNFIRNNYSTDEMVFSVLGNIPWQKVKHTAEKYLARIPQRFSENDNSKVAVKYKPRTMEIDKPTVQSHFMLGNKAYSIKSKYRLPFILLNNILGGPGLNSRLNLGIREKFGFAYALESSYDAYRDSGIFTIYLSTEKKSLEKTVSLVYGELKKLREKKISSLQLRQYKQQLIGQVMMSEENRVGTMLANGKNVLTFGRIFSTKEIVTWIESISSKQLREVANEIFEEKSFSTLEYKAG
ncbi:MAG: pitrilysin family protein [Bacteroidota bacterium]